MLDGSGRRLLLAWLREPRSAEVRRAAGWAGCLSLPQVLDIGADGHLTIEPAPELAVLRTRYSAQSRTVARLAWAVPPLGKVHEGERVAVAAETRADAGASQQYMSTHRSKASVEQSVCSLLGLHYVSR